MKKTALVFLAGTAPLLGGEDVIGVGSERQLSLDRHLIGEIRTSTPSALGRVEPT